MAESDLSPSLGKIIKAFLHLGATAYGGLAMVEPIRRRVVQEKRWLSQQEFLDGLALCQLVPGATVVQLATYVGFRLRRTLGALAAAAHGKVDGIILTGGIAYGKEVVDGISAMCSFIAPIVVYPGEGELEALAKSGFGAISGKTPVLEYRQ